jgi:hypothetical protein
MAWQLTGNMIEACSCELACPCALGPAQPDQGWCSGAFTFVIERGQSDGVDLSDRRVLWLIDLNNDFASGNGTARVYVDDAANADQRRELESIFTGRKGGPGEVMAGLVSKWLPTESASIEAKLGDTHTVEVRGVGNIALEPVRNQAGQVASVVHAPVLGLIAIDRADLARGNGSRFAAADMRQWESGGHGSVSPFTWKA